MALPKFEDFNKRVTDLFKDDYTDKCLLKIKHTAPYGVSVTSETEHNCKGDKPSIAGKLTLKWKHASGFALDKLQFKNNDNIVTETSMTGVAPGLKFTFKGDDSNKGDLGVEYSTDNMMMTGELDVVQFSEIRLSSVFGYQNLLLGGNLAYRLPADKAPSQLNNYTVAAGYNAFPWFATVGSTNLNTVDVHMQYNHQKHVLGMILNHDLNKNSSRVTAGGLCNCSPTTAVRSKLIATGTSTNDITVAGSVAHTPAAGLTLLGSVEAKLGNVQNPKFGFQVTLG
jgi:hypothetical protein